MEKYRCMDCGEFFPADDLLDVGNFLECPKCFENRGYGVAIVCPGCGDLAGSLEVDFHNSKGCNSCLPEEEYYLP